MPAGPVASSELDRETLIRAFRLMYLSRSLDDREILLKQQNKIFFQISGAGHEAIQLAASLVIKPGSDWVVPYYRDRALLLGLGETPEEMLLQAVGAGRDPNSGGRQMPSHWSSRALHVISASSPTGTQFLHALGCAQAKHYLNRDSDEITLVCSGEGATSEGEFWECMNAACLDRVPLLVLVEDNGWAISVPVERQTAGGNVARLLEGFPHLLRLEVDGTDFVESYRAMSHAAAYCRAGHGPALVHASVIRPYSHALSDDERLYKSKAERARDALRDPLKTFPEMLVQQGVLERQAIDEMMREIDAEGSRRVAARFARSAAAARLSFSFSLLRQGRSVLVVLYGFPGISRRTAHHDRCDQPDVGRGDAPRRQSDRFRRRRGRLQPG